MKITDIPSSGHATVRCVCGEPVVVVDRYITDYPPIPRRWPEMFIEFYRDRYCDPDDRLSECPRCGEWLDLATVTT